MYDQLPEKLKEYPYFCGWKYENRGGRKTKVPKTVRGFNASTTNLKDFCPFGEIIVKADDYDGIGIVIAEDIVAIDIDHCIKDGVVSEMAKNIISKVDSYTEISPSGKGIRIIGTTHGFNYAREKYYVKNSDLGLEVYAAMEGGRFVTITGNAYGKRPLRDITEELPEILDNYMQRPVIERPENRAEAPGSFLSDEEVVEKACNAANGKKFEALYDGLWSEYYPSQSEAELAFMIILAFWCGGDAEQMERIYYESNLYREKWEREDYRNNTIKKALNYVTEYYMPLDIPPADEDFGDYVNEAHFPETPIPLDGAVVPEFPVNALPKDIAEYVSAVSESIQTPIDVAACAALSVLSIGMQGKYVIRPKADWAEPVNTFIAIFMPPSERKSAVCSAMGKPMNEYEKEWNSEHSSEIEFGKAERNILERRLKSIEEQAAKGKAELKDVKKASNELHDYEEVKPLRFYEDDVTTEKLNSIMSENKGRAAIFTPEGGIFDLLKGIYSKNVNLDVFLKGYSGDPIRVDRIGRKSEVIYNPVLTVMLMAQPNVLAGLMDNDTFRGRGLTARFLYCIPRSKVGERKYRTKPVPAETYHRYQQCIKDILADEPFVQPEEMILSPEADRMLEEFSESIEPKLKTDYSEIADWAGKLVGSTVRIAALLCRAEGIKSCDHPGAREQFIVSGEVMANAICIGKYFIEHAMSAFSLLGADEGIKNCKYVLESIRNAGLSEVSRRDIMRLCRRFKTKEAAQPVIDQLIEYGYLAHKPAVRQSGNSKTQRGIYLVNPCIYYMD